MEQTISENLQNSLVYLTIVDDTFARMIGGQVPPEFFSFDAARQTYKIAVDYYRKFNQAPGKHFHDELLKIFPSMKTDEQEILNRYIVYLEQMGMPNREYVLSRLNDFIRSRSLVNATYKFAEMVEKGQFDQATSHMYQALKAGLQKQNVGIRYFGEPSGLEQRGTKPIQLFKTGISPLDYKVRLQPTDLITIAGIYKGTKSWFGVHLAREALLCGLKVVHVSHENSLEDTVIRYDQMFGALTTEEKKTMVEFRKMDESGKMETFWLERDSVFNHEAVLKARKSIMSFGGDLIIQKYPMGLCTPVELESYINYLENFENFKADVLINDYADIMAPLDSTKQTRDSINETYMYLKRIADDKKLVMITMSQVNDEGLRSLVHHGRLEGRHLAEDKRKFANVDKGFFVGRTTATENRGEAIVGCFANRNGIQGQRTFIGQNLEVGQFFTYVRKFDDTLL